MAAGTAAVDSGTKPAMNGTFGADTGASGFSASAFFGLFRYIRFPHTCRTPRATPPQALADSHSPNQIGLDLSDFQQNLTSAPLIRQIFRKIEQVELKFVRFSLKSDKFVPHSSDFQQNLTSAPLIHQIFQKIQQVGLKSIRFSPKSNKPRSIHRISVKI